MPLFARPGWYLGGGTALALQVGHRVSVDLDFFTPRKSFNEIAVERELLATDHWDTSYRERGTIYGALQNTKMSLIAYPFFIPSKQMTRYESLRILTPADIAVMKIIAVSQRGRKRDFVDLYWYCTHREPISKIIARVGTHYPGQEKNIAHFLKSLTYFADAEADPMPKVFFKSSWQEIKKFFRREAAASARELIGLT